MLPFLDILLVTYMYWLHTCSLTTRMYNTQRTCNYELQTFVVSNNNRSSFIHSFQLHHGKQSEKGHCMLRSMPYEFDTYIVYIPLGSCYVRSRNEWQYDTIVSVAPSSEINMS